MYISSLKNKYSYLRDAQKIERPLQDSVITYLRHDNCIGDNLFSRYYILDLDENQKSEDIYSFISNKDKFNLLQNTVLAEDFYNSSDELRFNLYLIILTKKINSIKNLREIQRDYNFCRKLVFDEELANIYFGSFNCTSNSRLDGDVLRRNNNSEFVKKLASVEKTLIEKTVQLYLQSNMENRVLYDAIPSLRKRNYSFNKLNFLLFRNKQKDFYIDRYMNFMMHMIDDNFAIFSHQSDHFFNEQHFLPIENRKTSKSSRNKKSLISDDLILNFIMELKINNYKNFSMTEPLHFARVNLIYGENGSGKTTIIDCIKSALTGNFHEKASDANAEVCVICQSKSGKAIQFSNTTGNNELENYAQLWYNVSKDNLAMYFDKYNYFDGGRALDFALNDLNISDLFIDSTVVRSMKELYNRKKIIASQVEYSFIEIEKTNLKTKFMSFDEASKKLQNESVSLKEIKSGVYQITMDKPFKKYSKGSKQAVNSIRYQNLRNLRSNIQAELETSEENAISNSVTDELGINSRVRALFLLLTSARDYSDLQYNDENSLAAIKINSKIQVLPANMSTGQRVCFALASLLASFLENSKAPNIIILDEPVANLDDLHLLNMLDILRQLAINGTQIFFTTANESVAKLFIRKFAFLKNDFKSIKVDDVGEKVIINKISFEI